MRDRSETGTTYRDGLGARSLRWSMLVLAAWTGVASAQQSTQYDPYDPYDPTGSTAARTQNGQSTQQRRAGDAAQSQTAAPSDTTGSYSPDDLDRTGRQDSDDTGTRDDRSTRTSNTRNPVLPEDVRDELRDRAIARQRYQPSEFETFASKIVDKPLRRFGANLLVPRARDFTTAPTTTVPPDYRLNPGDEVIIGLTGSVEARDLRLTIDSNGRIFVPRVGAVTIGGVRYGDARAVIARRIERIYRGFQLDVAPGRLRGITVYVTGFAATPGSYTISSLSTLVNAVLAAGGPSAGGSFRSIQLRRGGRLVSDFDLYDLLLKGDKSGDASLQNGDVIYIAPVGAQVAVIGSVNNEAIYEAGPRDTVEQVLLYAGGVNTVADASRLLVLDPVQPTGGWVQITPDQARTQIATRGQVLRVLSAAGIAKPLEQQPVLITVSGEVARPGRYYLQPGARLDQVLQQAGGLTTNAFAFGSVLTRDTLRQEQRDSFDRALKDVEFNLTAQPVTNADRRTAFDVAELTAIRSLVEQLRERKPDGRFVMDVPFEATALPGDLIVQNNDTLYVPARPISVGIFGAVPSPASFGYAPGRTIGDYLRRAGGVQKLGDRSQIFVVRANGSVLASRRALFKGSILNERALPGDLIYVPINAQRGIFWVHFRDTLSTLSGGALAAASINAVAQ